MISRVSFGIQHEPIVTCDDGDEEEKQHRFAEAGQSNGMENSEASDKVNLS